MGADLDFRLEPWDERGPVLDRRANTPAMKAHLGGVESEDAVEARHRRIQAFARDGTGRMFLILVAGAADPVGSVGYWEREWRGETVYEMGRKVLPAWQGRGLAAAAAATAAGLAAAERRRRWAHAYPRIDNAASHAVCRRAGFELVASATSITRAGTRSAATTGASTWPRSPDRPSAPGPRRADDAAAKGAVVDPRGQGGRAGQAGDAETAREVECGRVIGRRPTRRRQRTWSAAARWRTDVD
jgi:RimJ/RimL family protein N-acetyltransferase